MKTQLFEIADLEPEDKVQVRFKSDSFDAASRLLELVDSELVTTNSRFRLQNVVAARSWDGNSRFLEVGITGPASVWGDVEDALRDGIDQFDVKFRRRSLVDRGSIGAPDTILRLRFTPDADWAAVRALLDLDAIESVTVRQISALEKAAETDKVLPHLEYLRSFPQ
jgi:hypothetical protein